jgi:cob(I)alamin adenosyltransferase
MGNRLSKIYTKTGDSGTTGLGDGSRISKASDRINAIGEIDELNCNIGLLLNHELREDMKRLMIDIQHDLFVVGGELSIPGSTFVEETSVKKLEDAIDQYNKELPPLKEFILPGGSSAASAAHLCRAVCRRAERATLEIEPSESINHDLTSYINRLSDLFFVVARIISKDSSVGEILWQRK